MLKDIHIKQCHEMRDAGEDFAIVTGRNLKSVVIPLRDEPELFWAYANKMRIIRKAIVDRPRVPA